MVWSLTAACTLPAALLAIRAADTGFTPLFGSEQGDHDSDDDDGNKDDDYDIFHDYPPTTYPLAPEESSAYSCCTFWPEW